jgi:hypothetical protein
VKRAAGDPGTAWERVLNVVFYIAVGVWLISGIVADLDPVVTTGMQKLNAVGFRIAAAALSVVAYRLLLFAIAGLRPPSR